MPKATDTKEVPDNYSKDALRVLEAMSLDDNLEILGSMSLRSQQYAGDYDAYEVVHLSGTSLQAALKDGAKRLQKSIRGLKELPETYIGDIKAGVVAKWRIIPANAYVSGGSIKNFDVAKARERIDVLFSEEVITEAEAKEAHKLLPSSLDYKQFLVARDTLKYHIVRWTPKEVLAGTKKLIDGTPFSLEDAINSPGITKVDAISWVDGNRFTDFSCIYQFRYRGKVLNDEPIDVERSLKESIVAMKEEGNHFKALKRVFALAKLKGNTKLVEKLVPILNSDLGRLYHVVGDIRTLQTLLEDHKPPSEDVRFEIDQFKRRLSTIYTLKDYLAKENDILRAIDKTLSLPVERLLPALEELGDTLDGVLQRAAARV